MLIEQPVEPLVTPRLFEQILGANGNLVALRVADIALVVAQFRQASLRSGQAIYLWQPETGVVSLRDSEVRVPGGRHLSDALQHVLHSIHFGIYLLTGFENQLNATSLRLLRRIARIRAGNNRKLVFLAADFGFTEEIDDAIEYLALHPVSTHTPRLRDGRWVT
ncbi:MAG TPA: hypothetical protein VFG55_08540 [Rhodanobacteraceae bacterium]|nr:hypothetical protein [Rhodanobacteraceae bacterium]